MRRQKKDYNEQLFLMNEFQYYFRAYNQFQAMNESPQEESKQRPYICPCGKSYLSYPALFTHIKQKHQGVAPGEIIRPKVTNKRGRPRKAPNESNQEANSPQPSFKSHYKVDKVVSGTSHPKQELDQSYLVLLRQAQQARKNYQPSMDFVAPITFANLSAKLGPRINDLKADRRDSLPHPKLLDAFNKVFSFSGSNYLNKEQLEELIKGNHCYQQCRVLERCRSRRPLGMDLWEMQLRTGLFQFLEWAERGLDLWEFKNVELLVGLMLFFYRQMLPQGEDYTTDNYLVHLNLLVEHLTELPLRGPYQKVYSLCLSVPLMLLANIQEWFVREGLSRYEIRPNPRFYPPSFNASPFQH